MAIEFVNIKEIPEATRPFDFYIDSKSPVGNPSGITENDLNDYKEFFNKKLASNSTEFIMYLNRMSTMYREFHKLRLIDDNSGVCNHGEIIKDWVLSHYNS